MRYVYGLFWLAAFTVSAAHAQAVLSPQSIIINPEPAYEVRVSLDRDASGEGTPVYNLGERVTLSVSVSTDSYVYLYNVRASGEITQFFPNTLEGSNYVRVGEVRTVPAAGARYALTVSGPEGLDKVIAVASQTPLDTQQLARFESGAALASSTLGEDGFARALSIIVEPLPQTSWVTDTVLFYVGQQAPPPRFGAISITSTPSGARAFVDGQYVGTTPLSYGANTGRHEVRVESSAGVYQTTVEVQAGQTQTVQATLAASPPILVIQANVGGAQVILNGQAYATIPAGSGQVTLSNLSAGAYELVVTAAGYSTFVRTITLRSGETTSVGVSLQRR